MRTLDEIYAGRAPFVRGSDTSEEAATRIGPRRGSDAVRILEYIIDRGPDGATDDEIEESLGLRHQTASARRRELELGGQIRRTERRRRTRSGRRAGVYVATVVSL